MEDRDDTDREDKDKRVDDIEMIKIRGWMI